MSTAKATPTARINAVLAAALLLANCALAQPVEAPNPIVEGPIADDRGSADVLGLRQIGSSSGLPQMTVFALAQDRDGYVYAGTQDGAARWDGRSFINLPLGISTNNWVTHLWADNERLWIGTDESGLHAYQNGQSREVLNQNAERLPAIEAIAGAARGGVWVGTPRGLLHCVPQVCTAIVGSEDLEVAEVLETAGGALWVGTNVDGLYRFDLDKQGHLQRSATHLTRRHGLPNEAIRALLLDRDERLWIGSGRGLARWDGHTMTRWTQTGQGPLGGVFDLGMLPDGSIMAALWGGGLAQFGPDDGFRIYGLTDGLPDSYLQSLLIGGDADEAIVWLGSASGGVLRLESGRWRNFDERHGLPQRVVVGVGQTQLDDQQTTLWAGTLGGPVRWQDGRWLPLLPPPYAQRVVYDVLRDNQARQWYATSRGVLYQQAGQWHEIDTERDGLPGASAEHLLLVNDEVWVGTAHGLAAIVDGRVRRLFADQSEYSDIAVRSMALIERPGEQARVLIGTGKGVLLTDGKDVEKLSDSCASDSTIYDIEPLRDGDIWLGTRKGAMRLRWRGVIAQCEPIGEASGNSKTVYEISQDQQGRVYLFGYDGVRRFDNPADLTGYRRFGLDDGLPALEFNRDAYVDASGRVWAANADGLVVYDPNTRESAPREAPLRLDVGYENATLNAAARLPALHGELEFRPRLLSFRHEHRIRYRTQLIGLEAQPSEWAADGDRRYPRIPAGDYRFQVEALDAAGKRHGPVEFPFHIAAPWWQHPLALLSAALALLATGLGAGRFRARALAQRSARLESLVAERTQALALASNTDPLTGAWNRRYFYSNVGQWLRSAEQGGLLFLLIDIDFFKQINDVYGHAGGDSVLVEVAQRLRTVDAKASELIRWGGEEFLLIFRLGTEQQHARAATTLNVVSSKPIAVDQQWIEVRCSIGYTLCDPQNGAQDDAVNLAIQRADAALYRAKREGRNRAIAA